jgi:hypothetical protein
MRQEMITLNVAKINGKLVLSQKFLRIINI